MDLRARFTILFTFAAAAVSVGACGTDESDPGTGAATFVQDSELAFPGEVGEREHGLLLLEQPFPIVYEVIDDTRVLEGDILLDDGIVQPVDNAPGTGSAQQALAVISGSDRLWPGGVVPFAFSAGFSSVAKTDTLQAMAHVEAEIGIHFVARTSEADYVNFVDGGGCSSYVGRIGGPQDITLRSSCGFGGAVHEILHALGAWHEQMRNDRDQSVTVLYENIQAGFAPAFDKYPADSGMELTAYDLGSIMHYGSYAFSKNGKPTIVLASNGATFKNNRSGLSEKDTVGMRSLYSGEICGCAADQVCNDNGACVYFLDVPPNHTHATAINKLYESGVTKGCGPFMYCPSAVVNREQMATFLTRALGLTPVDGNFFVDVPDGSTHEKGIYAIYNEGITKGCGPNLFCPKDPVKRDQMASFLARAIGLSPMTGSYFVDTAGNIHEGAINAIFLDGVTMGCGGGKYCPAAGVTRAQMASFLVRAFDL